MECNRDEAIRAKEIAENKFTANDVSGAKRFALKAQHLYPDLKGLSQMLAMLDVHLSAEKNKIDGEPDWYGILGVDPSADNETIKKQYRKLALMIHSDKNKSAGADEAFQLIWDARDFLLSDHSKRIAYNQKRFPKTSQLQHDHVRPSAATGASEMGDSSTPSVAQDSTVTPSQNSYGSATKNVDAAAPNWGSSTSTPWRSISQQQQNSNHHSKSQTSYASATNMDVPVPPKWDSSTHWVPISQQQQNSNHHSLAHDICYYCCCCCCHCSD